MKNSLLTFIGLATISAISTASAATVTVLPGDSSWISTSNSGGGSSAITNTAPRSGNGSLELTGDKTRFVNYLGNSPILLSSLSGFTFDWMVATDSLGTIAGANPAYSPAIRLHITDGGTGLNSELIWENPYNGSAAADPGTWYTTDAGDNFWRWVTGVGDSLIYTRSIDDWTASSDFSADAYITAISVGVGSSAGAGYHAFADNVTLTSITGASTTYNFEASDGASVPDAGSTLLLMGSALTGLALWKRKSTAKA